MENQRNGFQTRRIAEHEYQSKVFFVGKSQTGNFLWFMVEPFSSSNALFPLVCSESEQRSEHVREVEIPTGVERGESIDVMRGEYLRVLEVNEGAVRVEVFTLGFDQLKRKTKFSKKSWITRRKVEGADLEARAAGILRVESSLKKPERDLGGDPPSTIPICSMG